MRVIRVLCEPEVGEHISQCIEEAIAFSQNMAGFPVEFEFNGIYMYVSALDTLESVLQNFYRLQEHPVSDRYEKSGVIYN